MTEIESFPVGGLADVPVEIIVVFDGMDDRLQAGFANYEMFEKFEVIVRWDKGEPTTVLVVAEGIVTAAIHAGPGKKQIERLVNLVRKSHPWLIVHDADDSFWLDFGFVQVEPPLDVDEPVLVYVWGVGPEYARAAMKSRGLSWVRWGGTFDPSLT